MTIPDDGRPAGPQLGGYQLLGPLGRGAGGQVHRAVHLATGREVAVKEVSSGAGDARTSAALRREAAVLAAARHPNVVGVHEVVEGELDGLERTWLVQDLVAGPTLAVVLRGHGPMTAVQALAVLRGALTGLAHVHGLGLVHGDISPDNVLVDLDGTVKLGDFGSAGSAGVAGSGAPSVGWSGPLGTPAYASPEAVRGGPLTPASDVYSAGALLHQLLSGTPPFPRRDAAAVLQAQVTEQAPRWDGDGPHVAELVQRALAKDPAARPADAGVLLAELEAAAERTHGAGWLAGAGLGGLVAGGGATAAVTAAGSGSAGAAGTAAAGSVLAAAVAARSARPVWSGTRRVLVGASAAAVVAIVAVALVVTAEPDVVPTADLTPTRSATPTTDAAAASASAAAAAATSSAAAQQALVVALPTGAWSLQSVIVTSTIPFLPAGQTADYTWDVTSTCADGVCAVEVESSLGLHYEGTFDGTSLALTGIGDYQCIDVPGTARPDAFTLVIELTAAADGTFSGRSLRTSTLAAGDIPTECPQGYAVGGTATTDLRMAYSGPPSASAAPTS